MMTSCILSLVASQIWTFVFQTLPLYLSIALSESLLTLGFCGVSSLIIIDIGYHLLLTAFRGAVSGTRLQDLP
jgi:hypothetical protein